MEKNKELKDRFYNELLSKNRMTFVYTKDEEYIGEISIVFNKNAEDYSIPGIRLYVSRIIVKKEFRGRGYGKELMKHIIEYAKKQGYSELSLGVNLDNYIALKLYVELGFDKIQYIGEKMKKKYITIILIILFIIGAIVTFLLTNKAENYKKNNIKSFESYVLIDDLSNIDLDLIEDKKYVKAMNKNFDSKVSEGKFLNYTGNISFIREEHELKMNSFTTILSNDISNVQNIPNLVDEFVTQTIEYIGNYDELIDTMFVINDTIEEVDNYSDIVSGRAIYRKYIYVNGSSNRYIIDVYNDNNNIVGEISYIIDVEEIKPEDAVG